MLAWESVEKQLIDVKKHSWVSALQVYGALRSIRYFAELVPVAVLRQLHRKKIKALKNTDVRRFKQILDEVWLLIQQDSERMAAGLYPVTVLKPDLSVNHWSQLLQIWLKGYRVNSSGEAPEDTHDLDLEQVEALRDVPGYYRQHFKYAGTAFLNAHSVSLYEHQMELLFLGAMDAMRRLILAPMKNAFRFSEGEGLRFLEIGCGSGRMTQFVKMAFPKAKIVVLDASPVYLKESQKKLSEFSRIDFIQGDALDLPFKDERFDGVYMSFLLHEVPVEIRRQVLSEAYRVLAKKGFLGVVDFIQHDDARELNWTLEQSWFLGQQPFLSDYTKNNLYGTFQHLGLSNLGTERGFLGKTVFGIK
jgi:ubiquinone/menaquinone biosynthesis C-methylase UbiE